MTKLPTMPVRDALADTARRIDSALVRGARTEETGGGCTALVVDLLDGMTVVLTNACTVAPEWDDTEVTCGVYAPGQWTDEDGTGQHEPLAHRTHDDGLTLLALTSLITRTVADARSAR